MLKYWACGMLIGVCCSSCSNPVEMIPEQKMIPAFAGSDAPYVIPDTVSRNVAFDVIIFTSLGCGEKVLPAIVAISENTEEVTAQARYPQHEKGTLFTCPGTDDRSVGTVFFADAGTATVRLHASTPTESRDTVIAVPV